MCTEQYMLENFGLSQLGNSQISVINIFQALLVRVVVRDNLRVGDRHERLYRAR